MVNKNREPGSKVKERLLQRVLEIGGATTLFFNSTSPISAETHNPGNYCPPGQQPEFVLGFAELKRSIGEEMGEPLECEHANPENGDSLQQTSKGLAFYRKKTNTPTFTDGYKHWGLTVKGLAQWEGEGIDPPGTTAPSTTEDKPPPTPKDLTPELEPFSVEVITAPTRKIAADEITKALYKAKDLAFTQTGYRTGPLTVYLGGDEAGDVNINSTYKSITGVMPGLGSATIAEKDGRQYIFIDGPPVSFYETIYILKDMGATAAHEYFHFIENEIGGRENLISVPRWFFEGSAEWFAYQVVRIPSSADLRISTVREPAPDQTSVWGFGVDLSADRPLRDIEDKNRINFGTYDYGLSSLAVRRIAEVAGNGSIYNFLRRTIGFEEYLKQTTGMDYDRFDATMLEWVKKQTWYGACFPDKKTGDPLFPPGIVGYTGLCLRPE